MSLETFNKYWDPTQPHGKFFMEMYCTASIVMPKQQLERTSLLNSYRNAQCYAQTDKLTRLSLRIFYLIHN